MSACCVSGCKNRQSSTRKLKFYRIPFQANRRRLWLTAIQRETGSTEPLRGTARVCGAHFKSSKINHAFISLHVITDIVYSSVKGGFVEAVTLALKLTKTLFVFVYVFLEEASTDSESPDFVPSVFTCTKQSSKKKGKW